MLMPAYCSACSLDRLPHARFEALAKACERLFEGWDHGTQGVRELARDLAKRRGGAGGKDGDDKHRHIMPRLASRFAHARSQNCKL